MMTEVDVTGSKQMVNNKGGLGGVLTVVVAHIARRELQGEFAKPPGNLQRNVETPSTFGHLFSKHQHILVLFIKTPENPKNHIPFHHFIFKFPQNTKNYFGHPILPFQGGQIITIPPTPGFLTNVIH